MTKNMYLDNIFDTSYSENCIIIKFEQNIYYFIIDM